MQGIAYNRRMYGDGVNPETDGRDPMVLIVCVPFRSPLMPALGPSLLKAALAEAGHDSRVVHANLDFAERIGYRVYDVLNTSILGEYLFSCCLYDRNAADRERFFDGYLEPLVLPGLRRSHPSVFAGRSRAQLLSLLDGLVAEARAFVEETAAAIADGPARVVGFSSTFHENLACLSLARALKAKRPDAVTVLGGANCTGVMGREIFRRFPQLDYVVQGDADLSFPLLVDRLARDLPAGGIQGVLGRGFEGLPQRVLTAPQLDALPMPDFDDYFVHPAVDSPGSPIDPDLVIETARGCWWGADPERRCVFCSADMEEPQRAYRAKSGERVFVELRRQCDRHGVRRFQVTDNILNTRLLPSLGSLEGEGFEFFLEAPGRMSRQRLETLAAAGAVELQPGIESLGRGFLDLLKKPTTALDNLRTLIWGAELGLRTTWNCLHAVPGERDEDYDEVVSIAEVVHHLEPPHIPALPILLQRFSPLFERAQAGEFGSVEPAPRYRWCYEMPPDAVERVAFEHRAEHLRNLHGTENARRLAAANLRWRSRHGRSHLLGFGGGTRRTVLDTRACRSRILQRFEGLPARLLDLCDGNRGLDELCTETGAGAPEVRAALEDLERRCLTVLVDHRPLSLVVRWTPEYRRSGRIGGRHREPAAVAARRLLRGMGIGLVGQVTAGLTALVRTARRRIPVLRDHVVTSAVRSVARLFAAN